MHYEPRSIWRAKQLGGPELNDHYRFIGWDGTCDVIADLIDHVQNLCYITMVQAADKGTNIPMPDPYPRPIQEKVKKKTETLDNFVANNIINLFGPGVL